MGDTEGRKPLTEGSSQKAGVKPRGCGASADSPIARQVSERPMFDSFVLAVVACDAASKRGERKMLHDLREHEPALVHWKPSRLKSTQGCKTAHYSSNRDQDLRQNFHAWSSSYRCLSAQRWDSSGSFHMFTNQVIYNSW